MEKIYIFDVDGTLTPSRLPMTEEFQEFFKEWIKENKFYLVTGSNIEKLQEQMCYFDIEAQALFTCCGNEMWIPDPHIVNISAYQEYENKFKPPETLKTYLGLQVRLSETPVQASNHREDRGSMLNFSVVGRDCTLEERKKYFEWDSQVGERKRIAKEVNDGWPDLEAVIGGQISIDIVPKGMDKSQILKHIEQKENAEENIFFGDRTEEGGNDYPLAYKMWEMDDRFSSYQTEDIENTMKLLNEQDEEWLSKQHGYKENK